MKRKATEDNEEEEDDDEEKDDEEALDKNAEGVVQKRKRKKKQKKAKGISNWIYISGLPMDVTVEEIRDHFSKVSDNLFPLLPPLPFPLLSSVKAPSLVFV